MCVQVQSKSDQIDVTGTLAISKESTLHTLGATHLCQFSCGNCTSSVIVRVNRHHKLLTLSHVSTEVLNLIGEDIRRGHLDGGRQVEDNRVLGRRLPSLLNSLADLDCKVGLRIREGLRRELKLPFCAGLGRVVLGNRAGKLGAANSHLQTLLTVHIENNSAEARACGEVDVEDGLLGAPQRINGATDEVLTAW